MKKNKTFYSVDEIFSNYSPEYTKILHKRKSHMDKADHRLTGVAIAKKLTQDFKNTIS